MWAVASFVASGHYVAISGGVFCSPPVDQAVGFKHTHTRRAEVKCYLSVDVTPAAHRAASHLTPAVVLTSSFHTSHILVPSKEDVGFVATAELFRAFTFPVIFFYFYLVDLVYLFSALQYLGKFH